MKKVRLIGLLCILAGVGVVTGGVFLIFKKGPLVNSEVNILFGCAILAGALLITGPILVVAGSFLKD